MRAISSCHAANWGSSARNQANAARVAGSAARLAISCWIVAETSGTSARGVGGITRRTSYNGWPESFVASDGSRAIPLGFARNMVSTQ